METYIPDEVLQQMVGEKETSEKATKEENSVSKNLIDAIDKLNNNETPYREQKMALIAKISENLVEQMDAYLRAEELNSKIYEEFTGAKHSEFNESSHLRGELFEQLVSAEYVSNPPEIGLEVLSLMRNPARFDFLKELGYVRNPDLAVIDLNDEGILEIQQAGDAKLGLFNWRMYKQFKESGFKYGMEKMSDAINKTEDLTSHGLTSMQTARDIGSHIEVATNFNQYVIVPYNRDINNPESLINQRDFRNQNELEDFKGMLQREEITVVSSLFTTEEIVQMGAILEQEIAQLRANSLEKN